ncbi:MAG: hypothetical protein JRH15_16350 [Deltaproteobacteria bacterium]|nr:hypothetical protein [Deltaproteobacteria bacterium]
MDQKQLVKQMIEVNKSAFDTTFDAINKLQDQLESMTNNLVDQASWLPKDGKQTIDEWVKTYKDGRDGFKKSVDDNYEKVLGFFGEKK